MLKYYDYTIIIIYYVDKTIDIFTLRPGFSNNDHLHTYILKYCSTDAIPVKLLAISFHIVTVLLVICYNNPQGEVIFEVSIHIFTYRLNAILCFEILYINAIAIFI